MAKKNGRPSVFKQEIIDDIFDRLARGEPLAEICRTPGYPCVRTVNLWCEKGKGDEALVSGFARARKEGFDAIAWRLRETARGLGESTGDVARDKLIIETDLKLLAKWDATRYGDRVQHANDPDNPMPAAVEVVFVKNTSQDS